MLREDEAGAHERRMQIMATLSWDESCSSSTSRFTMKIRSASSPRDGSIRRSGGASRASRWRKNPYAKRITAAGRRGLAVRALVAELGPQFAILAPDLARAFPDSEAVNAALRVVLEASRTVRKAPPKRRRSAA
jgi:hypothetical protein